MKDAGILTTAKHYPGHPKEYRDPPFSMCENNTTLEECGTIPLNPDGIHRAAVIALSPDDRFHEGLSAMIAAFSRYGIEARVVPGLTSKEQLRELSKENDLIVYACYLGPDAPYSFHGYSQRREINTLFHGLSFGAEKSIIASFGSPTVYFNYFKQADVFIQMYTANRESMDAFVDGIFGKYRFHGTSPVSLRHSTV